MSNEPQWILEEQLKYGNIHKRSEEHGLPVEANQYEETLVSEYEKVNGFPYLADKLQIRNEYQFDPEIKVMTRAVEDYILDEIKKEGGRDIPFGYERILERMTSLLPLSLEEYVRQKQSQKALELLFQNVALKNNFSGQTFKKVIEKKIKDTRVNVLLSQIKQTLITLTS